MNKIIKGSLFSCATLAVLLLAPTTSEAAPSAMEIVKKAYCATYYMAADGRATLHMEILDDKGSKRVRDFIAIRRDEPAPGKSEDSRKSEDHCGDQKAYNYFQGPADVKGMTFMVHKNEGSSKGDDRWMYLPALDLVKRVAPSDARTSFFGSHFYYEDISGRHLNKDNHKLVETTKNYYVIQSTPKKAKGVEFASYKAWIHKTTFIPVKIEFTDKKGKMYRRLENTKVETIQGYRTITAAKISDSRIGGYSTWKASGVKYNVNLDKPTFSERSLRTPPRNHLK